MNTPAPPSSAAIHSTSVIPPMTTTGGLPNDGSANWRRGIYWLLIVASLGTVIGRIWSVEADHGLTPFLSANDRSRWCTIRTLVEQGTFEIETITYEKGWNTIDKVRHRGADGKWHEYSSKPPLLATVLAAPYWVIYQITGQTLGENPMFVGRLMLMLFNGALLGVYFYLMVQLVERYGTGDLGRILVMTVATFGTFLTTFGITLNNHLPAAVAATGAIYAGLRIWIDGERRWRFFFIAGLCGALAAANDLPALSLAAALGGVLLLRFPMQTIVGYIPGAALVAAAALGTTWIAHGTLIPPYAYRNKVGAKIVHVPGNFREALNAKQLPAEIREALFGKSFPISEQAKVEIREEGQRWVIADGGDGHRLAVVASESGVQVHDWLDWYDYPKSYWVGDGRRGVDRGEPSRLAYAFHIVLGHHGIFSLAPIWALTVVGIAISFSRRDRLLPLAALATLLTLVCLAFYVSRGLIDRNYGGVACGFRWLFWLYPLWLVAMLPAAARIAGNRTWFYVTCGLLAVSVVSAAYASLNPWVNPWIYEYAKWLGWVR